MAKKKDEPQGVSQRTIGGIAAAVLAFGGAGVAGNSAVEKISDKVDAVQSAVTQVATRQDDDRERWRMHLGQPHEGARELVEAEAAVRANADAAIRIEYTKHTKHAHEEAKELVEAEAKAREEALSRLRSDLLREIEHAEALRSD